jgi:hypothetical protein
VIIGASGGDKPTRGNFVAVDAQTGKLAWRVYTVPGDPSLPVENEAMRAAAKTWGGDFFKNGGGGAVWDGFAYDPEANLVYVGTGNAQPWVQKFRGAQGLDNLYTCAILAVDLTTGEIKWHYQAVPNDNWDYDNVQQLTLLDLPINGRMRKVITQAPKNGFFYVLDRVTGEFISAEPFVKVSWALRMGADGRPVVNPAAYYDQEPISVFPTGGGGHNWSPMSYNPNTGLVYIPASYQSYPYQAQAWLHWIPAPNRTDQDDRAVLRARANTGRAQRAAGVGSCESETAVERCGRWWHRRRHGDDRGQPGVSGDQRRPLPRDQRRQGRSALRGPDQPHGHGAADHLRGGRHAVCRLRRRTRTREQHRRPDQRQG